MKRNKEKRKMLRDFFSSTKPSKTQSSWRCPNPKALREANSISSNDARGES